MRKRPKHSRGISLLEVVLALTVLAMISLAFIEYKVQDTQRENMQELANFIFALDKGFYDATQIANPPQFPVSTNCPLEDSSAACLYADSSNMGFIQNLTNTTLITSNKNVPPNLLDPSIVPQKFTSNYNFVVWANPLGTNNEYKIYEMEIWKSDGRPFTSGQLALLFDYMPNRICIDSNGHLHYFLNGTQVNTSYSNPSCPSGIISNYYIIQAG